MSTGLREKEETQRKVTKMKKNNDLLKSSFVNDRLRNCLWFDHRDELQMQKFKYNGFDISKDKVRTVLQIE